MAPTFMKGNYLVFLVNADKDQKKKKKMLLEQNDLFSARLSAPQEAQRPLTWE